MPLTLRCRRVWSSNLSTQLRRTLSLNTESLTMPATVADPNRSLGSEQISPATIAHHTVYENTPNLHQSHICQWGAQPYLVGPLSRLVGKLPLSPWVSADFLPLTQVVNNTNSAIPLTEIFDRVFSDVCNSLGFEVQKQKKRGSGNNRVYRNLKVFPPSNYRSRAAWACIRRFSRELFDRPRAPWRLKVRLLRAEAMEALLFTYECMTWAPAATTTGY